MASPAFQPRNSAGDALLQQVAERFRACVRETGRPPGAAMIGTSVLQPKAQNAQEATALAWSVQALIAATSPIAAAVDDAAARWRLRSPPTGPLSIRGIDRNRGNEAVLVRHFDLRQRLRVHHLVLLDDAVAVIEERDQRMHFIVRQ